MSKTPLDSRSIALRETLLRTAAKGGRGHIGPALSIVEIIRVLYDSILRISPERVKDPDRDRFILSKGHGCLAQYVLLAEKGFFPTAELDRFCHAGGLLGGHPEPKVPGVEFATGSLGHGLPVGVGLAIDAKVDRRPYRTFILMGDGECNEGSVWEAALHASKHKLTNLVAMVDYNQMMTYSTTHEVLELEPFAMKWQSFGFAVREVDGHHVGALTELLGQVPFEPDRPSLVLCHTTKGRGIPSMEGKAAFHHKPKLSGDEAQQMLDELKANA